MLAIKKVDLSDVSDQEANAFRQEIELLLRLQGNKRIVKLIDFEERTKADGMGKELLVVMEKGSRDLANLLKELSGIHNIFSFTYQIQKNYSLGFRTFESVVHFCQNIMVCHPKYQIFFRRQLLVCRLLIIQFFLRICDSVKIVSRCLIRKILTLT